MLIPKLYFDDSINSMFEGESKMKCDIYEKDNKYFVEMDLPGYTKEEIKIECDKGNLSVKASKEQKEDDENRNYIRRERVYNEYSRSFYLGDIDEDMISAKFADGTLTITVPKKQEIETKKHIEIN